MIDVSDGLCADLGHLADASGVGVALDQVPVGEGATLDEALTGGEDYELVFTAPGSRHRGRRRLRRARPGLPHRPLRPRIQPSATLGRAALVSLGGRLGARVALSRPLPPADCGASGRPW